MRSLRRLFAFLWLTSACGNSDTLPPALPDPGPDAGLAQSKRLLDLTPAEKGALCDWTAGRFGGYGRIIHCADTHYVTPRSNQSECISYMGKVSTSCSATVQTHQDCVNEALAAAPCEFLPPACVDLALCGA